MNFHTLVSKFNILNNGFRRLLMGLLCLGLIGCSQNGAQSRAVFVLVDISSDYASELHQAQTLTRYLLGELNSGDSLAIAFIDNSSFTERNIIARATFDHRPSVTTHQKRLIRQQLDAFVTRFRVPSHHSDITGGLLLGADYLHETGAGQRQLFILSDLHEDLPPWLNRDVAVNLQGVQVVAINAKRQQQDNHNPAHYRERLSRWQERVEASGGHWHLVSELGRLEQLALH
ncbi:VWA domain-containing protein [Marinimicrobium alkaliphilum]|uniref:VWA domain-containing protein n=1 Tax=Marinimicrobium alkaliphilum TaxID=2202654 RepID=UPI000DB9430C|nr:VWA domain-containing protein [Marinimicrobium alkaliphilum]